MNFEDLYMKAKMVATEAHALQKYGNTFPYSKHLNDVDRVLRYFGHDSILLIGAWLHDVVEDTKDKKVPITLDFIEGIFGKEIRDLIDAVTDEEGTNRKERKAKTLSKTAINPQAIILKLADRIANVENCIIQNSSLLGMYQREQQQFQQYLHVNQDSESMWKHLDTLFDRDQTTILICQS